MITLSFQSLWTIGPLTHQFNLRDIETFRIGGAVQMIVTNGANGGVSAYAIDQGSGGLSFLDSVETQTAAAVGGPVSLQSIYTNGQQSWVETGSYSDALQAWNIDEASLLAPVSLAGSENAMITTVVGYQAATREVIYAGYWGRSDIGIYEIDVTGALTEIGNIAAPGQYHGADHLDMRIAQTAGQDILLTSSRYDGSIQSYKINSNGGLSIADTLSVADGLPINTPSALETVASGRETFVVLAASGTSSLTVFELAGSGALTPVDHITASTHTRIGSVQAISSVAVDDRAFVVAGGRDDGLSLFQILPNGRLFHHDTLPDETHFALQNVTAVHAEARGAGLDIYASSEAEAGITQIRAELGVLDPIIYGTSAADTLQGGSNNDLIFADAGNDTLHGGGGADILMDGAGNDVLYGGLGADIFIFSDDGEDDAIMDFELGVDRVDLSGFGRVYRLSDLDFSTSMDGGIISFGDERLVIHTAGGTQLSRQDFADEDVFNLSHTDLSYMSGGTDPLSDDTPIGNFEGSAGNDVLNGSDADDRINGRLGDDTLRGGNGDDVLIGGAGADFFDGGAGDDWASYEGSRGSLRVDLMYPQINTNVGIGDSYADIENLIGSQGFDNLRGTLADNIINGARNVDYIFGRRGNDTLEGGIGDDVLFGGVGEDVLRGGENRDRAQYSESLTAVTVDLMDPSQNTGEAAGDQYDSIEDLAGGWFNDNLLGDTNANRLFGREGADHLVGRAGNDYLNGGAHSDTLEGGAGDDILRGGQNADVFIFDQGADTVEDFADDLDLLLLASDLIGGGVSSADRALDFAQIVDGNAVFDFDTGDHLTVLGVSNLAVLVDDIEFF